MADAAEIAAANDEHARALAAVKRTCECCGQYKPLAVFFDPAVRAANERISRLRTSEEWWLHMQERLNG